MLWLTTMGGAQMTTEIASADRHVHDLVFLRDLFAKRGATSAELYEYDAVIETARAELAALQTATALRAAA
jgi:hypothetical protein